MNLNQESIALIRERYGYARAEVIHRLDNRYKVLQHILAVVTAAITVISQLHWDFVGFLACALFYVLTLILYAENKHIFYLSDYMAGLERILDTHFQLDTIDLDAKGWERVSRTKKTGKSPATRWLLVGAMLFFFCTYGFFNLVGCRWLTPKVDLWVTGTSPWITFVHQMLFWMLAATVQSPCLALIVHTCLQYRRFWLAPSTPTTTSLLIERSRDRKI